jgi:hypothetical protein
MSARMVIPNPKYPGAPTRMSDGRLFTDYRPNCDLMTPLQSGEWAEWERRQNMIQTGEVRMKTDRSTTVMRAGSLQCVDTMVPELKKRVCGWDGCVTLQSQAAGIGTGRMYLPGNPALVAADPDVIAQKTVPPMFGTFSPNPQDYVAERIPLHPIASVQTPMQKNRYSAPYGN